MNKDQQATWVWQKWRFSAPHQHLWGKSPPSPSPKTLGCEKT